MADDRARPAPPFPYMRYAKQRLGFDRPMNLGMSGIRPPADALLADLGVGPLSGAPLGAAAYRAALAARFEVDPAQVHPAVGTSHANFLIANKVVCVPVFGQRSDSVACKRLARLFPTRRIVPIRCDRFVEGMGALHCVTQQIPA